MRTFHFLQFLHRHRIMDENSDISQKKTTVKDIYSKFVFCDSADMPCSIFEQNKRNSKNFYMARFHLLHDRNIIYFIYQENNVIC